MAKLDFTPKQKEFWKNCNCRWNIKSGATRSGKTFLDYYLIPKRIRAVSGKDGLYVILGNTKSTLQRNIIEPLQNIWGVDLVSDIKADNTAMMFGEKVHCIGADKINQVNRLRGSSIKYCYGDEVVTWHEDVFNMLKSRLDKSYSRFDGTCNPESPRHWFKEFLDSDADIFYQQYTLYDNPFNPPEFVKALEIEYGGTVYFDRYVLGLWKRAEGVVFPDFADNPENYLVKKEDLPDRFQWCAVGYDLGGNKSHYGLVASALGSDDVLYVLKADEIMPQDMKPQDVEEKAKKFIEYVEEQYKVRVKNCYIDDAYYTIINGLNSWRYIFDNASAIKSYMPLIDRPIKLNKLMHTGRFKIVDGQCRALVEQLQDAVYDENIEGVICDDGSQCIDMIDGFFYSIADEYAYLTD
jgi:PBSX family phage terminase large subunit